MNTPTPPDELLDHLEDLRTRARNDRRAGSTPLLVLGAATLIASVLPDGGLSLPHSYYWSLAGPLVFAVTAGLFRRREARAGVGTPARSYRRTAIVLVVIFLLLLQLATLFGAALAAVGIGLLVMGIVQRNLAIAAVAVVFGVTGVLESLHVISNGVEGLTGRTVGSGAVIAVLGVVILGTGLALRVRESASS